MVTAVETKTFRPMFHKWVPQNLSQIVLANLLWLNLCPMQTAFIPFPHPLFLQSGCTSPTELWMIVGHCQNMPPKDRIGDR